MADNPRAGRAERRARQEKQRKIKANQREKMGDPRPVGIKPTHFGGYTAYERDKE